MKPTKDSESWLYWPKASEIDFSGEGNEYQTEKQRIEELEL